MSKPSPGYYRQLLADTHPQIRIAFTHTPIIGCRIVEEQPIIEALQKSTDEYAPYYIQGLQDKSMVSIIENAHYNDYYKNNGELYFKS